MAQTRGDYLVGISFNPGGRADVTAIKRGAADLIDLIGAIPLPPTSTGAPAEAEVTAGQEHMAQVMRLKALAITAVEDAAMWAVKAATKPRPGVG